MESSLSVYDEYLFLFGNESTTTLPKDLITELLRRAWTGSATSVGMRAFSWRYFLGLISPTDKAKWGTELANSISSYKDLKQRVMPSLDKVKADPLSGLVSNDTSNDEWNKYYKNIELINFIKGDLDRLFVSGVDDEYFQSKFHRELLLAILFIWSAQHPEVSYRQGMHELVGITMHTVDHERRAFEELIAAGKVPANHPIFKLFTAENIEPFTFALFDRLMLELEPLYDPLPVQGVESQPFVVQYCSKIQEHYLRILDPPLAQHLEDSFVQSQLYGLRWSRLLLAREFPVTHTLLYRLWDFMFACCYDAENSKYAAYLDDDAPPNVYSMLAMARSLDFGKNSNFGKRNAGDRVQYVCTPLLGALGDLMLAMLIQIRTQLLEADSSFVIGYLMRYPSGDAVLPVIECADMIRRGVIVRDINFNGAVLNYNTDSMTPPPDYNPVQSKRPSLHTIKPALSNMGRKVTDQFTSVASAVGHGLSDLVNTIAPLLEYDESTDSPSSGFQSPDTFQSPAHITKQRDTTKKSSTSHYDYDDSEPSPPTAPAQKKKPQPLPDNVDPLMGTDNVVSRPKKALPLDASSSNKESSLTGMGTNYGNMPEPRASVTDGSSTPIGANKVANKKGGKSLFSPNWFPSSASKSKVDKDTEKGSRMSAGVDLGAIQSFNQEMSSSKDSKHVITGSNEAGTASVTKKKSKHQHQEDAAVGDRLLDLADELTRMSQQYAAQHSAENDESHDILVATAKRLQALVDVLGGFSSIVDYDVKFGNRALPAPRNSSVDLPVPTNLSADSNDQNEEPTDV